MAGVMIAAPGSGSGKTMVTCGLLSLLGRKGWNPAGFKCGPDYIDGLFHRNVLGVESGNLDSFFETPEHMLRKYSAREKEHFVVVEGVMGFFDGLGGVSTGGSSYEVARILDLPVILVVDAKGASLSLAALVKGFMEYVPMLEERGGTVLEDSPGERAEQVKGGRNIAGVLFNRMPPMMYGKIKALVEDQLHVPVIGYVPELDFLRVGSRHLGLILPDEIEGLKGQMGQLADCMERTVDLHLLAEISGYGDAGAGEERCARGENSGGKSLGGKNSREKNSREKISVPARRGFTLGVALDEAFCFYYRDNLDALEQAGASLRYFSPIHDRGLPEDVDGLLFGGGYPENHAARLSDNVAMRRSVSGAAGEGMPILGECGGYLYLLDVLESSGGQDYPMAGVFPGRAFRGKSKGRFGYITLFPNGELPYASPGMEIKGHEFHYWNCEVEERDYCMTARKPVGERAWPCMRRKGNVMAGFPHLYYPSCPEFVKRFADRCIAFGKEGNP